MRLLLFLLLISALMSGHHAQSVAGDLLALHPDLTAGEWLTQHAQDKLELFSATSYSSDPLNIDWCSRAESHFRIGDAELIRQAYFATPPVPDMRLPDDDGPHPELAKQCVLTAIVVKSTPGSRLLEDQLSSIKREMSGHLETGQPFDIKQGAVLSGSMAWTSATEWHLKGSRWIVGMDSNQKLIGLALSQEQDTKESPWLSDFEHQVTIARRFLEETGIPAVEKNEMRTLIDEADKRQTTRSPKEAPSPGIWVPFLVRWVRQSKALPAKRRAASLYVADFVLTNVGHFAGNPGPPPAENAIDPEFAKLRTELATVGAHFQYDELGGVFAYTRDWIQEAFRISPDSEPGQQAFLFLLRSSFHPSCCCAGQDDGFRKVIRLAPEYLREHPHWSIRPEVLLAIGDAYRDIIAVASGANGDPFHEAESRKPEIPQAYRNALKSYRAAIAAAPGSEQANGALARAWQLIAGLTPLDTRFVCIYD